MAVYTAETAAPVAGPVCADVTVAGNNNNAKKARRKCKKIAGCQFKKKKGVCTENFCSRLNVPGQKKKKTKRRCAKQKKCVFNRGKCVLKKTTSG